MVRQGLASLDKVEEAKRQKLSATLEAQVNSAFNVIDQNAIYKTLLELDLLADLGFVSRTQLVSQGSRGLQLVAIIVYTNSSSCLSIAYSVYIQSALIAALETVTSGPQRKSTLYLKFAKNSVTFIVSVSIILYTSYTASNNITQLSYQKLINSLRYCSTIWFRISICLSVCGQQVVESLLFVPRHVISACQNLDTNLVFLSIIYSLGYLQPIATCLQIISTSCSTNYNSLYRRKYTYLVSRSTTIRMLLYSSPVVVSLESGSLVTKSIATKLYSCFATGNS